MALAAACPVSAGEARGWLELEGYVSSWTQDCSGGSCALPVSGERNRPVRLRLGLPSAPGEAAVARAAEKLQLPGGGELSASLDFYAVCPYGGREGCAGRYFQSQVSLSGTAGAFCSAALDEKDFFPFPVQTCAGVAAGGKRFGITLHRLPL